MFKVTEDRIRDAYLYLRTLPPFSRWALPPAGECNFGLLHGSDHAEYLKDGKHWIRVNAATHITLMETLRTVAHEMCHLRQQLRNGVMPAEPHNAEFRRLRKSVCAAMGWDLQSF